MTLERGNEAYFPDAPTIRGVRHIEELIEAKNEGYESYIIFVVQMKGITCVYPNKEQQPEFAESFDNDNCDMIVETESDINDIYKKEFIKRKEIIEQNKKDFL